MELCHLKRGSYICLLSESNGPNLLDEQTCLSIGALQTSGFCGSRLTVKVYNLYKV
jgi:hypothetical protein